MRILAWRKLRKRILECERCDLAKQPRVLGTGKRSRSVVIVGESPGKEEIKRGTPFVGRSGRYLRQAMEQAGIRENQCYITNAVKCLPKGPIRASEIEACRLWLDQELKLIRPRKVITLGSVAFKATHGRRAIRLPHPAAVVRGFIPSGEFMEKVMTIGRMLR